MTAPPHAVVLAIRDALDHVGDPDRAAQQQRYMKSALPYRGLTAAELHALLAPTLREERIIDRAEWETTVRELWDGASHREEWYAALALLRHRHYRDWHDTTSLQLYEHLVRTGAWWDVVDEIASHLVGTALRLHREEVTPVMRQWAQDENMWLRRTAILCQLRHEDETDTELLDHAIETNLEGTAYGSEFFIRKAIGWSLRQYARTDADWVRAYVASHDERLSGLSRREALKHLG